MTQFEQALACARQGKLKTPLVSMGDASSLDYFGYQLSVHNFNLKIMANGMKFKGITFTQIKKYYGLKGKSAKDCLAQFEQIMNDYKKGVL